ncbi:MaoC/PaaZ C-terminal domain-containing protein [Chloroflexota bacterium]
MARKLFEDFNVGDKFISPGRTITEGAAATMIGYAGYHFPAFIDEQFAKTTIFGSRIIPGRLTLYFMGGLVEMTEFMDLRAMIGLVGINNIKFKNPVHHGDTIKLEIEVTHKRVTSNPERGIITHHEVARNQRGEVVAEADITHILKIGYKR